MQAEEDAELVEAVAARLSNGFSPGVKGLISTQRFVLPPPVSEQSGECFRPLQPGAFHGLLAPRLHALLVLLSARLPLQPSLGKPRSMVSDSLPDLAG